MQRFTVENLSQNRGYYQPPQHVTRANMPRQTTTQIQPQKAKKIVGHVNEDVLNCDMRMPFMPPASVAEAKKVLDIVNNENCGRALTAAENGDVPSVQSSVRLQGMTTLNETNAALALYPRI